MPNPEGQAGATLLSMLQQALQKQQQQQQQQQQQGAPVSNGLSMSDAAAPRTKGPPPGFQHLAQQQRQQQQHQQQLQPQDHLQQQQQQDQQPFGQQQGLASLFSGPSLFGLPSPAQPAAAPAADGFPGFPGLLSPQHNLQQQHQQQQQQQQQFLHHQQHQQQRPFDLGPGFGLPAHHPQQQQHSGLAGLFGPGPGSDPQHGGSGNLLLQQLHAAAAAAAAAGASPLHQPQQHQPHDLPFGHHWPGGDPAAAAAAAAAASPAAAAAGGLSALFSQMELAHLEQQQRQQQQQRQLQQQLLLHQQQQQQHSQEDLLRQEQFYMLLSKIQQQHPAAAAAAAAGQHHQPPPADSSAAVGTPGSFHSAGGGGLPDLAAAGSAGGGSSSMRPIVGSPGAFGSSSSGGGLALSQSPLSPSYLSSSAPAGPGLVGPHPGPAGRRVPSGLPPPLRLPMPELDAALLQLVARLSPSPEQQQRQAAAWEAVQGLLRELWPGAGVHLFGSGANGLGVGAANDLDVCLELEGAEDTREARGDVIAELGVQLEGAGMAGVFAIPRARMPVVKFEHPGTGFKVDITVNNRLAVVNTKLLRDYAAIDPRLRQLVLLVKWWAKRRRCNEAYVGTLSSYAYVLMVIAHLQARSPPVLPVLQEMTPTHKRTLGGWCCDYCDDPEAVAGFGARNSESIGQLLASFFYYWAAQHDYRGGVITIRSSTPLTKRMKGWTTRVGTERHLLCIEDPFELSHDLGRTVHADGCDKLKREFRRAWEACRSSTSVQQLLETLFAEADPPPVVVAPAGPQQPLQGEPPGTPQLGGRLGGEAGLAAPAAAVSVVGAAG